MQSFILWVLNLIAFASSQDFLHYQSGEEPPPVQYKHPHCDAGSTIYAKCVNHHVTVALSASHSSHFTSVLWSVVHSGISLTSVNTVSTLLKVNSGYPVCNEQISVQLTVQGKNGEKDSCSVTVVIEDRVKPEFTHHVKDITAECDDIPSPAYVSAKDECEKNIKVHFSESEVSQSEHGTLVLKRSWVAIDACGNANEMLQRIIVSDSEKPELVGVDVNKDVDCSNIPKPCAVVSYDNCDNNIEVYFVEDTVPGTCEHSYTIVRSWSATDTAYNVASASQRITVTDKDPPVIVGISSYEAVDCNAVPTSEDLGVSAYDECDQDVTLKSTESKLNEQCPHEYDLVITFVASDDCGNSVSEEIAIEVKALFPELSGISPDTTIPCGLDMPVCEPEFDDPCDYGIYLQYSEIKGDGSCEDEYNVTRTWSLTNVCGNAESEVQVVTVEDQEPPRFTTHPPRERTVSCDNVPTYRVTAVDDCDDDVQVSPDTWDSGKDDAYQTANYIIYRTWVASDNCGNTENMTQTIHVVDTVPPNLFGVPPDMRVECDAIPSGSKDTVSINDQCSCSHLEVVYSEQRKNGSCDHRYRLFRKWTGSDCSGNSVERTQTISVSDSTPPRLISREGVQVMSIEEHSTDVYFDDAQAEDNCAVVSIQRDQRQVPGTCSHNYKVIKTVFVQDDCGNSAQKQYTIIVEDKTPPVLIGVPYSQTWPCDDPKLGDYQVSDILTGAIVTVSDNSFNPDDPDRYPVTVYFNKKRVAGTCDEEYQLHLTWYATDDCSNRVEETIIITVVDEFPPVLTVPQPVVCDDCNIPSAEGLVDVNDNCDDVSFIFEETRDYAGFPCPTEYNIYRQWDAVDDCGNVATSVHQTVSIVDRIAPVFVTPAPNDTDAVCHPPPYLVEPVARDPNCYDSETNVELEYSEKLIFEVCEYSYGFVRTWVASDCLGNFAKVSQTVTIDDTIVPIFSSVVENKTVSCFHEDPALVTAFDNCEYDVAVNFYEYMAIECSKQYEVTRRWIATDVCGNRNEMLQIITVEDNEDPVIVGPADCIISCDVEISKDDAVCTDDCSYVHQTYHEKIIPNNCPHNYMVVRTWTCTDDCGKTDAHTQSIRVLDADPPVFDTYLPPHMTAECDNVPAPPYSLGGSDNCGYPLTGLTEKKLIKIYQNPRSRYTRIRTWILRDTCGNTAIYDQTIEVDDTHAPVFLKAPESTTVPCDQAFFNSKPWVRDNCGVPTVKPYSTRDEYECPTQYVEIRSWVASDECGNSATHLQSVMVLDKEKPEFSSFTPSYHYTSPSVTEENFNATIPHPVAFDACDRYLIYRTEITMEPGCSEDDYSLTRTTYVKDRCGNEGYPVTQVVEVEDLKPCPFLSFPPDITEECDVDLSEVYSAPEHNCSFIIFSESLIPGTCEDEGLVIKTWTISDDCGNSRSGSQTITISDSIEPTGEVPGDEDVQCELDLPQYIEVTDNCDYAPQQLYKEKHAHYENAHDYSVIQEWILYDRCGNRNFVSRKVTVFDDTPPEIGAIPINLTVDHFSIPPYPEYVTCEDNCANQYMSQTFKERKIAGSCNYQYTLKRTWTCVDLNGGQVEDSQYVEVQDHVAPTFYSCPPDFTQMGLSFLPFPTLEAGDGYGGKAKVEKSEEASYSGYLYSQIITRTWIASDDCLNKETCTQRIYITEPPPILCVPDNRTLDCTEIHTIKDSNVVTEEIQNCSGEDMEITFLGEKNEQGSCANEFCLIRKWSALDNKKGSILHSSTYYTSQTICVYDTHGPTWEFQAYRTVDCSKAQYLPDYLLIHPVYAVDDCGDVTVSQCCWKSDGAYGYSWDYTATDECGHTKTEIMLIQVVDMEDPKLSRFPETVTVDCVPPPKPEVNASDNCGDPKLTEFEVILEQSCAHKMKLVRGWHAVDDKGNEVIHEQTINVVDNNGPQWVGQLPRDRSYECDESLPAYPVLEAVDNCAYIGPVTYLGETHTSPPEISYATEILTVIRSWVVYDDCGQSAHHSQSITIYDTEHPQLLGVPEDTKGECDACLCSSVTAIDNCGAPSMQSWNVTTTGTCITEKDVITYWQACDDVGHCVHDVHTLTIRDTEPPYFTGIYVEDMEVDCHAVPPPPPDVVAHDNCDPHISVDYKEEMIKSAYWIQSEMMAMFGIPGSNSEDNYVEYDLIRTWSATDSCGHSIQKEQTLMVNDRSPPTFPYAPLDVTVDCHDVPSIKADMKADDNCDKVLYETFTEVTVPGDCDGDYTLIRNWTAIDNKQNAATHIQKVRVVEEFGPRWIYTPPRKLYVPCQEWPISVPSVTAEDECSDVTVQYTQDTVPGSCLDEASYIRTWEAKDICGHSIKFSSTVMVVDDEAPYCIKCPNAYEALDCSDTIDSFEVVFKDNCDDSISVSNEDKVVSSTCEDDYTRVWIWKAEDNCGNYASERATVRVTDTTPPSFKNLPDPSSYECEIPPDEITSFLGAVIVDDDCTDVPSLSHQAHHLPGTCEFEKQVEYTWEAHDACGNFVHASRTITVYDHTPPHFEHFPQDRTVPCTQGESNFNVVAKDNCDGVFGYVSPTTERTLLTCDDNYLSTYEWTASDLCGNTYHRRLTFTWEDTTPPDIFCPGCYKSGTFPCDEVPQAPIASATDDCDPNPKIKMHTEGEGSYEVSTYMIMWTWVATDRCGNSNTKLSSVFIEDTVDPFISAVSNVTVPCKEEPPVPDVQCHDNCDPHVQLDFQETTDDGTCLSEYYIYRSWICRDNDGYFSEASQTVTVVDTNSPQWEAYSPADTTLECDETPVFFAIQATDVCDYDVEVDYTSETTNDKCNNVTVHTWTATDDCGHTISEEWRVTVRDSLAPVLSSYPSSIRVPCTEVGAYGKGDYWPGTITASDNCEYGSVVKFLYERIDGTCVNEYKLVLTWRASDDCGNTVSHEMEVQVVDDFGPSFDIVPRDVTIGPYGQPLNLVAAIAESSAYDSCDKDVEITGIESKLGRQYNRECDNEYLIIRTLTATDSCGHSTSHLYTISSIDDRPPQLPDIKDITLECDEYAGYTDCEVVPTSPGDEDLDVHLSTDSSTDDAYATTVIKTWTVTDCAYNSASTTQTITVRDTTPPIFSNDPVDITVECDCTDQAPNLKAYDNCDEVSPTFDEQTEPGTCDQEYELVRTWSVMDHTGNDAFWYQTVTVFDNEPPEVCAETGEYMDFQGFDVTVECDKIPTTNNPTVTDNCDRKPTVDYVATIPLPLPEIDPCYERMAYQWQMEDDCGNYDHVLRTIHVIDTVEPELVDDDQLCLYPTYQQKWGWWAVYNLQDLFQGVDNCERDVNFYDYIVNTTAEDVSPVDEQGRFEECFIKEFGGTFRVYLKIDRDSDPPDNVLGRTYDIYATMSDDCSDPVSVRRQVFIPLDQYIYEHKQPCDTGPVEFRRYKPQF